MPDLNFEIVGAEVPGFAAVPTIIFKLSVVNAETSPMEYLQRIHSVALRCQIQLAVTRRHYNAEEQVKLLDVLANRSGGEIRCAICYGCIPALSSRSFQAVPS